MRPDHVGTCLEHLSRRRLDPRSDRRGCLAGRSHRAGGVPFSGRALPPQPSWRRDVATSRAIALEVAGGEVMAFLDDDAYADPTGWSTCSVPSDHAWQPWAAALNGQEGEETAGVGEIGRLREDGRLTGHFAAIPAVSSMSTTCSVPTCRSGAPSPASWAGSMTTTPAPACERTPTCRSHAARRPLRRLHARCRGGARRRAICARPRFDLRYDYYGQRNHLVLLSRTVGVRSPSSALPAFRSAGDQPGPRTARRSLVTVRKVTPRRPARRGRWSPRAAVRSPADAWGSPSGPATDVGGSVTAERLGGALS